MTMIQIDLPEATADAARAAGLLTPAALEQLIVEAIRRQAARRLLEIAQHIQDAGIAEMSMDEITEEVHAVRAGRNTRMPTSTGTRPGG